MKNSALAVMLLCISSPTLFADFMEPFTDSPPGKTVTGEGWVIADSDGKSGFAVVVFTDTGHRVLPAKVPGKLDVRGSLGRKATITATIQKDRSLEVTELRTGADKVEK